MKKGIVIAFVIIFLSFNKIAMAEELKKTDENLLFRDSLGDYDYEFQMQETLPQTNFRTLMSAPLDDAVISNQNYKNIIDNDYNTFAITTKASTWNIKLKQPTSVIGVIYKATEAYDHYFTLFVNNSIVQPFLYVSPNVQVVYFDKPITLSTFSLRARNDGNLKLYEIDFIVTKNPKLEELKYEIKDNEVKFNWKNNDIFKPKKINVFLNGTKIDTLDTTETYTYNKLTSNTKYDFSFSATYDTGESDFVHSIFETGKIPGVPTDVEKMELEYVSNDVVIRYKIPTEAEKVNIYRNGQIIGDGITTNEYKDLNVKPGATYSYKIVSINKYGTSKGITKDITIPGKEVSNLSAKAASNRVDLSWKLPQHDSFSHVSIYRTDLSAKTSFFSFFSTEKEEALFETNGTYFNDLTVKSDNKYRYRVTSVFDDFETQGMTVTVTTPKVQVVGGGVEKDEQGNYVISWTSPTTGKIKVVVGGKQYDIVQASDKKIVIPKDKMVFDLIGNPDVQLIPIDEDGNEGLPSKPGGNGTGNGGGIGDIVGGGDLAEVLNPENTVKGGVALLGVVGAFVLLGLVFRVVPKLVKMIRDAFSNKKDERIYSGRRRVEE